MKYYSGLKGDELLITWINLKVIRLSQGSQVKKRVHIEQFHLYNILTTGTSLQCQRTHQWFPVKKQQEGEKGKEAGTAKAYQETLDGDDCLNYHLIHVSKTTKLYTLCAVYYMSIILQ